MTDNVARTRAIEERSAVAVHRKTAITLGLGRIKAIRGLCERRIDHVGDQTPCNRGPDFDIINDIVCRITKLWR